MTKKLTKALAATLCAILLVGVAVAGTVAYLTSKDEVSNTFSAGNVTIEMDEAKVDGNGKKLTGENAGRTKNNAYKLVPARTYENDLVIHVKANSEACYLFVQLDANFVNVASSVTSTLATNGWTALPDVANVYYKQVDAVDQTDDDYKVFESFTVDSDETNTTLSQVTSTKVFGYAIQSEGLADVATAWTAVSTQAQVVAE